MHELEVLPRGEMEEESKQSEKGDRTVSTEQKQSMKREAAKA
jgi:hypothetical protein